MPFDQKVVELYHKSRLQEWKSLHAFFAWLQEQGEAEIYQELFSRLNRRDNMNSSCLIPAGIKELTGIEV